MNNQIPKSLISLAEKNHSRLVEISSIHGNLSSIDYLQDRKDKYNVIMTAFNVGTSFLKSIISNNQEAFNYEVNPEVEKLIAKNPNVAMLVVRPEMYHLYGKIEEFLNSKGLEVVKMFDLEIDYQKYLRICRSSVNLEQAKYAMPTRTLVYTGGKSKIIICKENELKNGQPLPNRIVMEMKGTGGIFSPGTIRGEVVYEEAKRLGFHELNDEYIKSAIDPFGVLKLLPEFPEFQTDLSKSLPTTESRLTYNAVAVHIPDSSEIISDLSTVLNSQQLQDLIFKL